MELSCDKAGSYCFITSSGYPNGTWNNQMGYGRVNAYNAVRYAYSTQINSYSNISGSDQGPVGFYGWVLSSGGCSGLAAATYYVKRHEVRASVSYPSTPNPIIIGSSNGFSIANPNNGNYYMSASNVTPTSATLSTNVYEITSISGTYVGWVPTSPGNIRFNYSVLGTLSTDLYFQNQNVTGTESHNAMNKIEAGRNVTTAVPVGNYVVKNNANLAFHAGNSIALFDGFYAEIGGTFSASVAPFFTCTQYPYGKTTNSSFPPVIQEYETILVEDTVQEKSQSFSLANYPNPFTNSTVIEYQIPEPQDAVTVTVTDLCGKIITIFKNTGRQDAGKYQLKLEGISLSAGTYLYTLDSDKYSETKKMIVTE